MSWSQNTSGTASYSHTGFYDTDSQSGAADPIFDMKTFIVPTSAPGTYMKFYYNGVLQATSGTAPALSDTFKIENDAGTIKCYINGSLDLINAMLL